MSKRPCRHGATWTLAQKISYRPVVTSVLCISLRSESRSKRFSPPALLNETTPQLAENQPTLHKRRYSKVSILSSRLGECPDQVGGAVEGNPKSAPGDLYADLPQAYRAHNNAVASFGQKRAGEEVHGPLVGSFLGITPGCRDLLQRGNPIYHFRAYFHPTPRHTLVGFAYASPLSSARRSSVP
jgi:hypothetical protein